MSITALPQPPTRSDPVNFNSRADTFLSALPVFATEANELQADVNAKQTAAALSASNAAAAELAANAAANVTAWVSGTTYAVGNVRYSPITFLSYRRKTAGAGTTDPSADSTNWQLINGTGNVNLDGTQTLTNKTMSTGSTWSGNAIPIANGGTGQTTAVNAFSALKQTATESTTGVVSYASLSDVISGSGAGVVTAYSLREGKSSVSTNISGFSSYSVTLIPTWATKIVIILVDVSTSAASQIFIRLNGLTTGYFSNISNLLASSNTGETSTTGIPIVSSSVNNTANDFFSGKIQMNQNLRTGFWHVGGVMNERSVSNMCVSSCVFNTPSALSTFSINTSSGTFDDGLIYVSWE